MFSLQESCLEFNAGDVAREESGGGCAEEVTCAEWVYCGEEAGGSRLVAKPARVFLLGKVVGVT